MQEIAQFAGSSYGKLMRQQFADNQGKSELAMLAAPSTDELQQLTRAVAIMTDREKQGIAQLSDEEVQHIAADARMDPGVLAIFINGYVLKYKRVSP